MTPPPRIVDLVFDGEPTGARKRSVLVAAVLATYAGVFVGVSRLGRRAPPPAPVHDPVSLERFVDLTPPPVPALSPQSRLSRPTPSRTARATRVARGRPVPPAQAAQLAAVSPEPLDFTGSLFVVGTGASYVGGTTTSTGTNREPAVGVAAAGDSARSGGVSRGRPVSLDQAAWNCPWPAEADAQQVDEQTVVLRARVREDGRADRVDVVSDPGFGFGAAARLCAFNTHFEPARDDGGQPITAQSPPIRVHFFR